LRVIIIETIATNTDCLHKPEIQASMAESRDLALGILMKRADPDKPANKKRRLS
jgi:hypothetical protein